MIALAKLVIAAIGVGRLSTADTIGRVDGTVHFDLKSATIAASLKYDYVAVDTTAEELAFYLNEGFDVENVTCGRCISFAFDRKAQPATIRIVLREPLHKGQHETIAFRYSGSLGSSYRMDFDFVELGLDDFWFPVHPSINGFRFVYQLTVTGLPRDNALTGNAVATRTARGWMLRSTQPDFDMDLVTGSHLLFTSDRSAGFDLQVVSKGLPDSVPGILLGDMRRTLDFYHGSFGRERRQRRVTAVIRPYQPIPGKGGYFRHGYFIFDNLQNPRAYAGGVAHELAHFWWGGAPPRYAWLNESFAEYSAMLALRARAGRQAFDSVVADKRKNSTGLPAIYDFDRAKDRMRSPRVLYLKGPVKLAELEASIGEEAFARFFHAAAVARVGTTDALLDLLGRVVSKEAAAEFLRSLRDQ